MEDETMRHSVLLFLVLVFLSPSFLGCNSGLPSEDDAKKIMTKYYLPQYEVVAVRKTDGVRQNFFGIDMYEMQVEVTIRCIKDLDRCKPGEILTNSQKVNFNKSENGWNANPFP